MWAIIRKDLSIELKTGEIVSSLFLLALLVVLIFAFALEPERLAGAETSAGVVWAALLLAAALALNRSFLIERESGAWTALALLPIDRGSIYLGKTIANLFFLLVAATVLLPLVLLLSGTEVDPGLALPLVLVLGVVGIAATGTLCAAMASRSRAREILLPLLAFPLLTPLLIAATRATAGALVGRTLGELSSWLILLVGFDIVFLTTGWLGFEYILEE